MILMTVPFHRFAAATALIASAVGLTTAPLAMAGTGTEEEPASARLDPLFATIELGDAERFRQAFEDSGGAPTAAQLREQYLDHGGRALEIFTPRRIVNADHLAAAVAARRADYADAIERCLPLVRETESDLRAIYLALRGLLPEQDLPRIAVVFGAGNSGGTAAPGMQVLGLEVLCRISPDDAAFKARMREFFAHETVHTFQRLDRAKLEHDGLLSAVIMEGTADYIAALVTGSVPDPARAAWAHENQAMVLREFAIDLAIWRDPTVQMDRKMRAYARWIGNAGSPPEGWPSELGYWLGMQIAQGYVENAADPYQAIRELLEFDDPSAVLEQSQIVLPTP